MLSEYKVTVVDGWHDYVLIDTGGGEKLERFGTCVLQRPEPQALWDKSMNNDQWQRMAHARFDTDNQAHNGDKGHWNYKQPLPIGWNIAYQLGDLRLRFSLQFNTFKHVGVFPEQADNWHYIYDSCKRLSGQGRPKVLNLFAYTGGATLAACCAGAEVWHVDSVRRVVDRANDNLRLSQLTGVHWVVDDAMKFVERERRRNHKYNGIILDPPAFGRGANGEIWILEKHLNALIHSCSDLLTDNGFFVLNMYSMGLSAIVALNMLTPHFANADIEYGENCLRDTFGKILPLGTFIRFRQTKQ